MKISLPARNITISLHVVIWGALLLLPYSVSNAKGGFKMGDIPGLFFALSSVVHMAIFYINAYYLYPKWFNRRSWWLYLLACAGLALASFGIKYYMRLTWFPEVISDATRKFIYVPSISLLVISFIYSMILDKIRLERQQKEQEAARLETELKFLRSQISPHFLFNTLTNLVSLARKKSDQLEPSLIRLSDLMRYMLYDAQRKKVALRQEVEYLDSYIELQRLRFGKDIKVDKQISLGEEEGYYTIEPMLLIPFVENAFKYGMSYNVEAWIDIRLSVDKGWMIFEVRNMFEDQASATKDESSGIGLKNVISRLDLLYKDNHTLRIEPRGQLFQIILTLRLI